MTTKIMQVFYGTDLLPYKDKERQVHFPIVGGAFLGASQTTEIRFYVEQIGSVEDTWVANSKLPNGKLGNEILSKGYDEEIGESYVSLSLKSFYTQAKGDLYISLNGFMGGVEIEEEGGVSRVVGIPTIQATGCVKLAINYATPLIAGDEVEQITLESLLAELGLKQDRYSPNNYRGYKSLLEAQSDLNNLVENQMLSYIETIDNKQYERLAYKHNGAIVPLVVYSAYADENGNRIPDTYETKENARFGRQLLQSQINVLENSKVNKPTGAVPFNKYLGTDEYGAMVWKNGGTGGSEIDDTTTATDKTWSSAKIKQEQDILMAVAEGKTKSYVLSYSNVVEIEEVEEAIQYYSFYKMDGTKITTKQEFIDYVGADSKCVNRAFNSQDNSIQIMYYFDGSGNYYNTYLLIDKGDGINRYTVLPMKDNLVKVGDIFLVVEINVPDRWHSGELSTYKLETAKIDLNNYYTKGEVEAIKQALQQQINNLILTIKSESTQEVDGVVVPTLTAHNVIDIHNALINGSVAKVDTYMVINSSENDSGDIIVNIAFDENTIVQYVALNASDTVNVSLPQISDLKISGDLSVNDYTFNANGTWASLKYENFTIATINAYSQIIVGVKINPIEDGKFDLGSTGAKWANIYANRLIIGNDSGLYTDAYGGFHIRRNGVDAITIWGGDIRMNKNHLNPRANNDGTLGQPAVVWKTVYTKEISDGTNTFQVADLSMKMHMITVKTTTSAGSWNYSFSIMAPASQTFTLLSDVAAYLYAKNNTGLLVPVVGWYMTRPDNELYTISSVEVISESEFEFIMHKATDGTELTIDSGAVDVIDTIL